MSVPEAAWCSVNFAAKVQFIKARLGLCRAEQRFSDCRDLEICSDSGPRRRWQREPSPLDFLAPGRCREENGRVQEKLLLLGSQAEPGLHLYPSANTRTCCSSGVRGACASPVQGRPHPLRDSLLAGLACVAGTLSVRVEGFGKARA